MAFHVGVDVGGTFTDLFAVNDVTGEVVIEKADTTPDAVTGVLDAIRIGRIPPQDVSTFVFGSTIATNALAERKFSAVAFLGTAGFTDTLEIRRVWREHLFGWHWYRPKALVGHDLRFGVRGRINWKGDEIEPLHLDDVDAALDVMQRRGVKVAAVSLLFSFLNTSHERAIKRHIERKAPNIKVVLSSMVNPEIKDYERASTTVVAAVLSPLVADVLSTLETRLAARGVRATLQVIKSNGGIMSAESAIAKPLEMVRSGPAGGVASALRFARESGASNLICVDIGGTTADVSVVTDGDVKFAQSADLEWDIPLRVSMADVRSIGAGGGSIAMLDAAGRLTVGPLSAGAWPGPACYGRGGEKPTVTDAAIVAGHLDPKHFLGGRMKIDPSKARTAVEKYIAGPLGVGVEEAACGVLRMAGVRMAQLIDEMTVRVGLDPRDYAVVGFGGAGALFLGALVQETEAQAGIVPPNPAVWSAFGGLFADIVHDYAKSFLADIATLDVNALNRASEELILLAHADLTTDRVQPDQAEQRIALDLRYEGQSHEITVGLPGSPPFTRVQLAEARQRFDEMHDRMFAHRRVDPCHVVTIRLSARVRRNLRLPAPVLPQSGSRAKESRSSIWFHGHNGPLQARVVERHTMPIGYQLDGPAIVIETQTHCVIPPGMRAVVGSLGELRLKRVDL
jgi:N-methylhydantoinase A/oxoprolinase/acetone carboxylase beta subunit